jgi:hypothetical protein
MREILLYFVTLCFHFSHQLGGLIQVCLYLGLTIVRNYFPASLNRATVGIALSFTMGTLNLLELRFHVLLFRLTDFVGTFCQWKCRN